MSVAVLTALLAALTGADVFGLVASAIVCVYLIYTLLRGENL